MRALLVPPVVLATLAAGLFGAGPSAAHPRSERTDPSAVLATDLLTPLSLAAAPNGDVWFSQNFRGALEVLRPGQPAQKVYQSHGGLEVGAVSVGTNGQVWFTVSGKAETYGRLMTLKPGGKAKQVADLGKYEKAKNPDGAQRYGLKHLSASCAAQFTGAKTPTYPGKLQTHPYATLRLGGHTFVADAAGNDILSVNDSGRVRKLAVLPPVKTKVTKSFAKQSKLPKCTIGKTYLAEPVPTDIEDGHDGNLYITTLPGGPGGDGSEAKGAVWRLGRGSGKAHKVVGGLNTPTGLAVTANGDIYVAELFGNQIVKIPAGTRSPVPFYSGPLPGDIDVSPTGLIATTNVLSGTSGKPGDPPNADVVAFH